MNMVIQDFSVMKLDWSLSFTSVLQREALNSHSMSNIGMICGLNIYSFFPPRLWGFFMLYYFPNKQKQVYMGEWKMQSLAIEQKYGGKVGFWEFLVLGTYLSVDALLLQAGRQ